MSKRVITAKFNSTCADTGRPIKKGDTVVYDDVLKKVYASGSPTQQAFVKDNPNTDTPLHRDLRGWNGHSRRGQAIYDQLFEREKADQERYDPSDRYGHYEGL